MTTQQRLRNKISIRILQFIILVIGMVLLGRLYQLQIVDYDKYSPLSRKNSIRQQHVLPARGLILDRNDRLLVDNEPIYTITITPSAFDTSAIPFLAHILETTPEDVRQRVKMAQRYSWHRSSKLYPEVNFRLFSKVEEHIWELPGISHTIESKRNYPTAVKASHILGYLREISQNTYEKSNQYLLGDKAGTTGIEWFYENYLRGEMGMQYVRINALGQELGNFEGGELDVAPISGHNLYTTIDTDLQRLAEELMVNKVGGLVAIDPRDGAIRALVSAPSYDLSRLAGKLDNTYWAQVNADSTTPLFNRAVSTMQPPGSTFKPVMGLIGLKMGLITPQTKIHCAGGFQKGRLYKCTGVHGDQDLEHAIQNSCNTYFFSLMNKIGVSGRFEEWTKMVKEFGLGVKNNIDLPNEIRGIIPDSSYFDRVFGVRKWGIGDVINLGVGQGAVGASPLQMSVVASALANGGYKVQPHIVRKIQRANEEPVATSPQAQPIPWVTSEYMSTIRKGMRKVVTDGSARWYANLKSIEVAGKTGTAQNPHGRDHAWFICYAPFDNPQLAVAVLVENAGYGSLSASPIASLLLEQFFLGEVKRKWVYDRMINFVPRDETEDDD